MPTPKPKKIPSVLVLNGPNLNMVGQREPKMYGNSTYAQMLREIETAAEALGLRVTCKQSNHEGHLIDWIQAAKADHDGIIINAGGFSHTSIALMDALKLTEKPVIEVHMSNIFVREEFRRHTYISTVADGVICGLGVHGYLLALEAMLEIIGARKGKG